MPSLATSLKSTPAGNVGVSAHQALDLGFKALGILQPFYAPDWELLESVLPRESICTLELFLPYPRGLRPGSPCPFRLGSPGAEDKRDALKYGTESVLVAERHRIPTVLVPPVSLGLDLRRRTIELSRSGHLQEQLTALVTTRQESSRPSLDALRSVLSKLLEVADRYGIRLALTPGGWLDELPNESEVAECLEEFHGAPLDVWPDTLRRHVSLELGQVPDSPREEQESPPAGISLRDHNETLSPTLPGEGLLNWKDSLPLLSSAPVWLLDPPEESEPGELATCRDFLEGLTSRVPDGPSGGAPFSLESPGPSLQ